MLLPHTAPRCGSPTAYRLTTGPHLAFRVAAAASWLSAYEKSAASDAVAVAKRGAWNRLAKAWHSSAAPRPGEGLVT